MNAIIAVGDTLALKLQVKTLSGIPVTSFDSVRYLLGSATDTLRVRLSSTGVVTGLKPTNSWIPVTVGVIAFKDGMIAYDASTIQVTPSAISGMQLSLQPTPPDSARWQAGSAKYLYPVVVNPATSEAVSGVALRFEFSAKDSTAIRCQSFPLNSARVAPFDLAYEALTKSNCNTMPYNSYTVLNSFVPLRPDTIMIHASVFAYGTELRDSLRFIVTNPATARVTVDKSQLGGGSLNNTFKIAISAGGTVTFANGFDPSYGTAIDFTFDHPEAATSAPGSTDSTSGNIRGLQGNASLSRQFNTPGTYTFSYAITAGLAPFKGLTGRGTITVQ